MGGVDAVEEEIGAGVVLLGGEDAAGREEREAADRVAVGGDGGRCELPERRREDGAVVEDVDEAAVGKEGKEARCLCQEAGEVGDEAGEADNGDGRRVEAEVDVRDEGRKSGAKRAVVSRGRPGGSRTTGRASAMSSSSAWNVVTSNPDGGGWCGGERRAAKKS